MNLMYLASNGLSSAQSALHVVGNNLNNAMTPGYSRQNVLLGEAGGRTTSNGFFGYGVQVNGVQRACNGFINNQLRAATTDFMAYQSRMEQLTPIDNMLGDESGNFNAALNNIFGSLEKMNADPGKAGLRQGAYQQFQAMAANINTQSNTLDGLEKNTNIQIEQCVNDINDSAKQLAALNVEIDKIYGQTGTLPANLLDQRDSVLSKLSEWVEVRVNENSTTGRVDVSLTNGLPLVNGNDTYPLQSSVSAENPNKTVVSYIDGAGNALPINESRLTGGKLGGLFAFRNEELVSARNQLNQLSLQMANKFNEVNREGFDRAGEAGGDIFTIPNPVALANASNSGDAGLTVSFNDIKNVEAQDYTLTFIDPDWQVTTQDGQTFTPEVGPAGELVFAGISVVIDGSAAANDSFVINPVADAAGNISVALSGGDKIAASSSADPTEESNNENLKALIDIQNQAVVGKSTLTDAFSSLVGSVGSAMSSLKIQSETHYQGLEAAAMQQQSVSGVDLNEEFINMQMFTQYYQANAQVLQTATTLFDTLLTIR